MSKFRNVVDYAFKKHPIITNCVVYGSLCVGAEFSQQTVTKKVMATKPEPFDFSVLGRYAVYGTAIGGPILTRKEPQEYDVAVIKRFGFVGVALFAPVFHYWYKWLDTKFVGTSSQVVVRKLLIDQFFFTPQLLMLFYVAMSVMERQSDVLAECKQKFVPTFKTSCLFWIPAQTVNFIFVPPIFRVAYVGTCSFAWVNILCWIKRQEY